MLPSDLLGSHRRGDSVYPRFLKNADDGNARAWAASVLAVINDHHRQPRGELSQALRALEGDSPDYRLVRGLAHLALAEAEFAPALGEPEPEVLRHEAFLLAAEPRPDGTVPGLSEARAERALVELAGRYGLTTGAARDALYADLPERQLLVTLPDYTPETLVDRYNLAQAQGLLYSALHLRVNAHRNSPGEYRRLFQRLKFHGLMYTVEGSLEDGYQIYVDGPVSLFKQTRKYGIQMAIFLPALLQVTRWEMRAALLHKDREVSYTLNSDTPLRSHKPKPPEHDSLLEQAFAERWARLDTPWQLEREVEIVDLKGTVMVPDFALRHPDGRVVHVEIVGFWHPEYLRRKFDKLRRANMKNLIVAVSKRLNVGEADIEGIAGPVIFFKGKLNPQQILALLAARFGG